MRVDKCRHCVRHLTITVKLKSIIMTTENSLTATSQYVLMFQSSKATTVLNLFA